MDALACRFGSSYTVGGSAVSSALLRCETPQFSPATIDRALTVDTSINGGGLHSSTSQLNLSRLGL
jgi:hypothetical protein